MTKIKWATKRVRRMIKRGWLRMRIIKNKDTLKFQDSTNSYIYIVTWKILKICKSSNKKRRSGIFLLLHIRVLHKGVKMFVSYGLVQYGLS